MIIDLHTPKQRVKTFSNFPRSRILAKQKIAEKWCTTEQKAKQCQSLTRVNLACWRRFVVFYYCVMLYDHYHRKRCVSSKCMLITGFVIIASLICLPSLLPYAPVGEIDGKQFDAMHKELESGTWLVAYYMPTRSHTRWASTTWAKVLEELSYIPHDLKIISVQTRPEINDFGRKHNILEWPTIEVFHDGMVRRLEEFRGQNKNDHVAILKFAIGGWKDQAEMKKSDLRMRSIH